jgi:hypothetical protein
MKMKHIIAMFLVVILSSTEMVSQDTKPHLLKTIVSGGNGNCTFSQVISGYQKNGFHVGFRIPNRVAVSVNEINEIITNDAIAYPNPTSDNRFGLSINNIESIMIADIYGKTINLESGYGDGYITLPSKGVYIVKVTTTDKKVYTTKVISN